MEIYLIRHGQSTGNGTQRFMGWSDHPLTATGRAQAEAVAARLRPLGPMPVYCSDLQRACETAEVVAACWNGNILPDMRWREVSCGAYEGEPWDVLAQNSTLTRQFDDDPYGTPMPGGESAALMAARATAAFTDLRDWNDTRVAVVTHDGPIRAVLAYCLQIPHGRFWALTTDHGGITVIAVTDGWISVRSVNDTSHLRGTA